MSLSVNILPVQPVLFSCSMTPFSAALFHDSALLALSCSTTLLFLRRANNHSSSVFPLPVPLFFCSFTSFCLYTPALTSNVPRTCLLLLPQPSLPLASCQPENLLCKFTMIPHNLLVELYQWLNDSWVSECERTITKWFHCPPPPISGGLVLPGFSPPLL